ncbi:cytochrome P450, partial [Mesorhizobium sp. M1C.F.Ca.ET.212.01.1.1]|uniref:cytochrome P450 n=1 Tax=Mesorhizobium sp. M1C.F.Ca.ET.212.01.1.1 TaxID=2500527 RepID=UPI001093A5CA
HEEIVSILRNWTVGELGTITACVGILGHYVAENPQVQQQLRENLHLLPAGIDEILRIHAPLISNRRVTTMPVEIGGRRIAAGERITLMWASADRDEAVFG